MPAEGNPRNETSLLARPLALATAYVLRFPQGVLLAALVLAACSVLGAVQYLGFKTNRLDLLNPDHAFNRRWLAYLEEFGDRDDAVILVEGEAREAIVPVLDQLAEELAREPKLFHHVLHQRDLSRIRAKGLHLLPEEELRRLAALVTQPGRDAAPVDFLARLAELEPDYLLSNGGRRGYVLLQLPAREKDSTVEAAAVDKLREIIRRARAEHVEVSIGLTGMPILEHDEMRGSQQDMLYAALASLGGVSLLFLAGFGGWRYAACAVLTLLVSLAWSCGYITLAVGHLNILSSAFAVILIGLGIDFSIHYVARYQELRRGGAACEEALVLTAESVGPGIVTGGVTTAVAFGATALADFVGVAELGLIAAGGLLLCLAGTMLVLPALLLLFDRARPNEDVPLPIGLAWAFRPARKFPAVTLVLAAGLVFFVVSGVGRMRYDHNLLNLQATRTESVEVEKRLHEASDRSVFYAVSFAPSRRELLERKARLERLASVERTEELASLVPEPSGVKTQLIAAIADKLAGLPAEAPEFAPHRSLAALADPQPPTAADLPPPLAARFVGQNQQHLMRVYARGNVWEMEQLATFVRELESVDPGVTGHPVQTYYASRQLQRSYVHAAYYALVAVAIVLVLDFRSVRHSLLALVPVGMGLLLMFGVLGLLEIPFNPANLIALPLIIGIGIDDGVHLVHDYRRQTGMFRVSKSTASAILLTSLTTMVGFGMMVLARHQGIRSLGQALTIGVACCLAASLWLLPALLALWPARLPGKADQEPRQTPAANETPSLAVEEPSAPAAPLSPPHIPSSSTLRAARILARRRRLPSSRS